MKETGGSAFPGVEYVQPGNGQGVSLMTIVGGMTLRDYFAARFAAAALQTSAAPALNLPEQDYDYLAGGAYKFADAMLQERDK